MEYSRDALGQVIEEHRVEKRLTQQQLGDLAKYQAGAAVSISRVEGGHVHPGEERRADIAAALGLSLLALESAAADRTQEIAAGKLPAGRAAARNARSKDLVGRAKRLEEEYQRRRSVQSEVIDRFTDAVNRSRDEFFTPLVDISSCIAGADQPSEPLTSIEPMTEAEAEATSRFQLARRGFFNLAPDVAQFVADGVSKEAGQWAAYQSLRFVVSFGKAGTGRPIANTYGAARDRGARARFGGGSKASGGGGMEIGDKRLNWVATGVELALPIIVTAIAEHRRGVKERQLSAELDKVETSLEATRRGYQAIEDILPRATEVLDEVAVHGTRALNRWAAELDPQPWDSLNATDKQNYQDFIELSTCQVVIGAIDIHELLESTGQAQENLIAAIDEEVNQAQATVAKLV
jgi:transcriptional regulator with XRE-family HTH domain